MPSKTKQTVELRSKSRLQWIKEKKWIMTDNYTRIEAVHTENVFVVQLQIFFFLFIL